MSAARAGSSPAFGTILKQRKPLLWVVGWSALPSGLVPRVIDIKTAMCILDF